MQFLALFVLSMLFAIIAVLTYFSYLLLASEVEFAFVPKGGFFCVAIAFVFDWLAMHAIKKDEELVRSVDRIR